MKQRILLFSLCCTMLCGCAGQGQDDKEQLSQIRQEVSDIEEGRVGDEIPVTRAMAAKMITLAFYTQKELKEISHEKKFKDVKEDAWYTPYVYGVADLGFMKGDDEGFHPDELVTLYQTQVLMDTLNPDSKAKIKLTEDTKNKPVSYSLWVQVFQDALKGRRAEDSVYSYGFLEKELVVLEKQEPDVWLTTEGVIHTEGYDMDIYQGMKLKVLLKQDELITLIEVKEKNALIENVGFSFAEQGIEIDTGYGKMYYAYEGEDITEKHGIGDIQLENGVVVQVIPAIKIEKETIKKANDSELYLEPRGKVLWDDNFKVYAEKKGILIPKSVAHLICGTDIADFYMQGDKVCVAVIRRWADIQNIRVLLSNTGFKGYHHDTVDITANEDFTVSFGTESKEMKQGEHFLLTEKEDGGVFTSPRIQLQCKNKGIFTLHSISKGGTAPNYEGKIEIEKTKDGYVLVNELPFEDYLKGVVPSEMPISFGVEALKVQAVSARSYGYNQFYTNRFGIFGAHVDDSVGCQVYNGYSDIPLATQAVEATKGMCVAYGNKIVNANFFSTSAGFTANSGEVWASKGGKEFPSQNRNYLVCKNQGIEKDYGNLSKEENMKVFVKDSIKDGYDIGSPWFRWNVTIPYKDLNAIISSGIQEIWNGNRNLIQTLQVDGSWKFGGLDDVGAVQDISVVKRGEGGNAMVLEVKGEKQTFRISTEYAIRKVLRPARQGDGQDIVMQCCDESTRKNMNLLPSGFFVIEEKRGDDGTLENVTLYGGGNGHGVGMSQYGAKKMGEKGFTYDEILEHYFCGAKVCKVIPDYNP